MERETGDGSAAPKRDLRQSSDIQEQESGNYDGVIPIPDLLRETDRRVKFAESVTVTKEMLDKVPGAFILHGVLTPEECAEYIDISEEMGYEPAPLRVLNGKENDLASMDTTIRNAYRVLYHAPPEVNSVLCDRILPFLPEQITIEMHSKQLRPTEWAVHKTNCINERWRFNRYTKGQYFRPHFDAGFVRSPDEKSHFTFIVYLNDVEGGETVFFPAGKPQAWSAPNTVEEVRVTPKAGSALVFYHSGVLSPRHEGAELAVEGQVKYIIRSDLMYTRIKKEDEDEEREPTTVNNTRVQNKQERKSSLCNVS